MMRTSLLAVLVLAGCKDNKPAPATKPSTDTTTQPPVAATPPADPAVKDRCQRGVTHVMQLMATDAKAHNAVPKPEEQQVIDAVGKMSISTCEGEGLSQEQLDCILAAADFAKFPQIRECPAIKAKPPSWLH